MQVFDGIHINNCLIDAVYAIKI